MKGDSDVEVRCSSNAGRSAIRAGIAGGLWGYYCGPYEAQNLGLTGGARASFEAKSMVRYGLRCGIFVGVYSVTRCELKKYRGKDDLVNIFIAGGLAGVVAGAGFRNWIRTGASLISILGAVAAD